MTHSSVHHDGVSPSTSDPRFSKTRAVLELHELEAKLLSLLAELRDLGDSAVLVEPGTLRRRLRSLRLRGAMLVAGDLAADAGLVEGVSYPAVIP